MLRCFVDWPTSLILFIIIHLSTKSLWESRQRVFHFSQQLWSGRHICWHYIRYDSIQQRIVGACKLIKSGTWTYGFSWWYSEINSRMSKRNVIKISFQHDFERWSLFDTKFNLTNRRPCILIITKNCGYGRGTIDQYSTASSITNFEFYVTYSGGADRLENWSQVCLMDWCKLCC